MMVNSLLIKNIKCLVQAEKDLRLRVPGRDMAYLPTIADSFLIIKNGIINSFGSMKELNLSSEKDFHIIDAAGKFVFPSFCDPHTHLVYAGSRETEFTDKIKGLSYSEIAGRGGGILNSAKLLHE